MDSRYPCLLEPIPLQKIWGGQALTKNWKKPFPIEKNIGESLEISDFPEEPALNSIIKNGSYQGKPLSKVLSRWNIESPLPLLIKLIEANQVLSVQNHPSEILQNGKILPGKTEAWFILEAKPDASLYKGFAKDTNEAEVRKRIQENSIQEILQKIPVQAGDFIYVPAGTIHAIDAGIVLLEIQQRTQVTYRVYDWGRVGDDGKPRELHLEEALKVMNYQQEKRLIEPPLTQKPFQCPYFQTHYFLLEDSLQIQSQSDWMILFQLSGKSIISPETSLKTGQCLFVPTSLINIVGSGEILQITL